MKRTSHLIYIELNVEWRKKIPIPFDLLLYE